MKMIVELLGKNNIVTPKVKTSHGEKVAGEEGFFQAVDEVGYGPRCVFSRALHQLPLLKRVPAVLS